MRSPDDRREERGMALVMAMLTLVVLSLVVAGIMASLNTDTKIASHGVRGSQAFYIAEAGVAEAQNRIRTGDIPDNANPRMVAQIFNTPNGSVPALGADSLGLATDQPAGEWLSYSTSTRSDRVLQVSYKTNAARTGIYRYYPTSNPKIHLGSPGFRIFTIRSTGIKGGDKVTVQTDVIQKPFTVNVRAAMAAQVPINFNGNAHVCGYNHSMSTPANTTVPACGLAGNHIGLLNNLPAAWSEGTITDNGSSELDGSPTQTSPNQTGFYAGPWNCLGMSQAEFWDWIGAPINNEPDPPNGLFYLDNDLTHQNGTTNYSYHGGNGEGMLYVDGNLTLNGNFTFVGLLYVEGDLNINGTVWILGALVAKGAMPIDIANGDLTVLWSSDAVQQKLSKYGGDLVTLSWREVR